MILSTKLKDCNTYCVFVPVLILEYSVTVGQKSSTHTKYISSFYIEQQKRSERKRKGTVSFLAGAVV